MSPRLCPRVRHVVRPSTTMAARLSTDAAAHLLTAAAAVWLLATAPACANGPIEGQQRARVVTASAYTSHPEQTAGDPFVAAWGDELSPGTKAIAVSRDLLKEGLTRGTRVKIEGLPGEYVVLDKMHRRWTNKIDIYMGEDEAAARRWGVREVRIQWRPSGR